MEFSLSKHIQTLTTFTLNDGWRNILARLTSYTPDLSNKSDRIMNLSSWLSLNQTFIQQYKSSSKTPGRKRPESTGNEPYWAVVTLSSFARSPRRRPTLRILLIQMKTFLFICLFSSHLLFPTRSNLVSHYFSISPLCHFALFLLL